MRHRLKPTRRPVTSAQLARQMHARAHQTYPALVRPWEELSVDQERIWRIAAQVAYEELGGER